MESKVIVAATGNKGKIAEIKAIFTDYKVLSYKDLNPSIEVDEDAPTFAGNALKKAKTIAKVLSPALCIADDSGIEIEAFNGWPGVRTARWMEGTDHDRNMAILEKMVGLPREKRKVAFITAISISDDKISVVQEHVIHGYISDKPRGNNGFGFDEIFELEDGRTLAELSNEEKNEISARKFALEKIREFLND